MTIFTNSTDKHGLERIRAMPTYGNPVPYVRWPRVLTWETEEGQVAVVRDGEETLLFDRGYVYKKPAVLVDVMIDIYGTPNEMIGLPAIQYLYHRFN